MDDEATGNPAANRAKTPVRQGLDRRDIADYLGIVLVAVAIVSLLGSLVHCAVTGEIAHAQLGVLLFLGVMTAAFCVNFLARLARHDLPRIESNWGGFGGGLGGWSISLSLAYLLASLAFAVLLIAMSTALAPKASSQESKAPASTTSSPTTNSTRASSTGTSSTSTPAP